MNIRSSFVLAASLVSLLCACRTGYPVQNIDAAPIASSKAISSNEVQKAILRAGAALGWVMKPVEPGLIVATLNLRKHTAVVDIKFNDKTYAIHYKDSTNLDYKDGAIHKNYNGWIENLDNGIKTQLNQL
jgi:hypothetical protein